MCGENETMQEKPIANATLNSNIALHTILPFTNYRLFLPEPSGLFFSTSSNHHEGRPGYTASTRGSLRHIELPHPFRWV